MTDKNHSLIKSQKGFTLVELAIVLIIVGLVASTVAVGFNLYTRDQRRDRTVEHLNQSQQQLFSSLGVFTKYPCPADPTLGPGNPNYGVGDCTSPNLITVMSRDLDNDDGDGDPCTGNGDLRVLIGALPFADLAATSELLGDRELYRNSDGFDGWNNQFTYAVTADLSMENPGLPFNEDLGAVCVVDQNNVNLLDIAGSAHAMIISHGENARGARNENGQIGNDCVDIALPSDVAATNDPSPDESENCDHQAGGAVLADAKFVIGTRNESQNDFYDDLSRFIIRQSNEIWARQGNVTIPAGDPLDPTDDIVIPQISATNGGAIGIGTNNPQQVLHLEGDLQASRIQTEALCTTAGTDCLPPELIGGDVADMQCAGGEVIVSIGRTGPTDTTPGVQCASPFTPASFTGCPAGQVVVGISNVSGSICGTL